MKELTTPEAFEILLRRLNACEDAVAWARGKTFREAWLTCERGDWMFWLAARAGVDLKTVVLAACACARLSLKYVKVGEDRPRIAIETAERWARGEATSDEGRAAAAAAYAAYAADAASSSYAAARKESLKNSADICREILTDIVLQEYKNAKIK